MTVESEVQAVVTKAKTLWVKVPTVVVLIVAVMATGYGLFLYGKRVADKEARIKELETQLDTLKKTGSALKQERTDIQQQTSETAASVRQNRASIQTPQQAVQDVNANLQTHIGIVPQENSAANVPDAPSVWSIPHSEVPLITTAITNYKVQGIELAGCKKELGVCDEQLSNKDAQIANLEKTLKLQKPSRFKQCLISMGSNTATGAVFAQDKKTGAIGGAVIGLGSCLIFK